MEKEQVDVLFKTLKPVLDPDLLYFAYYKGEPIGFFITIPELNYIVKHVNGKISGLGILKFLYYRYIKPGRVALGLIFGVAAEYQGRGVEAAMIYAFCKRMIEDKKRYDWLELSWVGDFTLR